MAHIFVGDFWITVNFLPVVSIRESVILVFAWNKKLYFLLFLLYLFQFRSPLAMNPNCSFQIFPNVAFCVELVSLRAMRLLVVMNAAFCRPGFHKYLFL